MNGRVLFEQTYKGNLWRLEIASYRGRARGNWRKWYHDGDAWKPSREGCTIPLDRLPELADALAAYASENAPSALKIAS